MRGLLLGASLALAVPAAGAAQEAAAPPAGGAEEDRCVRAPEPVVSLAFGSRYQEDSETRSDFDAEANAEVEAALGPVDDFVVDLVVASNAALREAAKDDAAGTAEAARLAACVLDAARAWAEADALSDIGTWNAGIAVPSRLGGIAMAYAQAAPLAPPDPEGRAAVEAWLEARMRASMDFFDTEAPPGASRNNLRAWAALAAVAVSRATGEDDILDWAADSVELVACQADPEGALPLEMGRGPLALHYQLHAVAPLVVAAAMIEERDLFAACDGAIHRVVAFTRDAVADPAIVEPKAGEAQSYALGDDELRGFQLAWAEAYLARFEDPALEAFVEPFRPLANSKLGGSQGLLW